VYLTRGNKTIIQKAVDVYGNEGNTTSYMNITNDGFELVFRPGWNLFSIPVNDTITVQDVFGAPGVNPWFTGAVHWWDESTQQWGTALGGTDPLDPKRGYFVQGPNTGTFEVIVSGTAEPFDRSWWVADWNMVGPGYSSQTISEWAYGWQTLGWSYTSTKTLTPGNGYWVKL